MKTEKYLKIFAGLVVVVLIAMVAQNMGWFPGTAFQQYPPYPYPTPTPTPTGPTPYCNLPSAPRHF